MHTNKNAEYTLRFLLDFNGRIHCYEKGYWVKFEITQGSASALRPHGLNYSFTLHDPSNQRLMGFDNAHPVNSDHSYKRRKQTMKHVKIQSHASLRDEMKAVARGEKKASKDAGIMSFNSVETLLRLLTPQNRALLAAIRDQKPQSIAELAKLTGRAQPNLTRTLGKLEAIGFVKFNTVARCKVPTTSVRSLQIKIDPFSQNDQLKFG
jgi:predicted transcriptional regulator